MKSKEYSFLAPRAVGPVAMDTNDVEGYSHLAQLGIHFDPRHVAMAANAYAMDDQQGGITTPSIGTPIQFLQTWLPGFVRTVTAARTIDQLCGILTAGSWDDEEIVQGVLEPVGEAVPYGDYSNVPLASYNTNFERRTVVRYENGFSVARLEEARAARMRVNAAQEKRSTATVSLEIQRNLIGFRGYNNGANRTYGFLNDPSLPAYVTVATGAASSTLWANKTFLEITADIRTAFAALQNRAQGHIKSESVLTLSLPVSQEAYLSVTSTTGQQTVRQWIRETYPNLRVVAVPELGLANGGQNVFYLYAETIDDGSSDDSRVWLQVVPAKLYTMGVQVRSKDTVEDFGNATAGVMLKRPFAVVRYTGI
jgi:hypothetical protein